VRALVLHETAGPEALRLEDLPPPAAPDGTTAIEVHAAGIGFVDWLVTRGEYQIAPPLPFVPGIEVAGTAGDRRVAATVPFGAFAEIAVAPDFAVFELPGEMSFAQGAAMVTNYQTAHLALTRRGRRGGRDPGRQGAGRRPGGRDRLGRVADRHRAGGGRRRRPSGRR
jgi:NADPH2:quinone reductase